MKHWFSKILWIISILILSKTALAGADLMDIFHDALANDPTFKAAQATYLANQENVPIARAALLPIWF